MKSKMKFKAEKLGKKAEKDMQQSACGIEKSTVILCANQYDIHFAPVSGYLYAAAVLWSGDRGHWLISQCAYCIDAWAVQTGSTMKEIQTDKDRLWSLSTWT